MPLTNVARQGIDVTKVRRKSSLVTRRFIDPQLLLTAR